MKEYFVKLQDAENELNQIKNVIESGLPKINSFKNDNSFQNSYKRLMSLNARLTSL